MECPICMNLLSETPDPTSPSLPPAKKQKKEGNNATSNTISTPCGHIFHRICLHGWLKKEHEILQEKHRQEKERADLNEAIVMSLLDENSDKTHTSNNNSQSQTKTDSKDRNGNSIESQSDEGGGVDVNVLNWFSSGFDYWFNDSGSNDNDESNWWE
ncbi:unnamed protein product [Orchesella dallaii]|uniref:RING-type domain-containing protein n=1 Tax=Orchesella dallaii TaxID=48710 RepID=A0ABP1QFH6_9HEXA